MVQQHQQRTVEMTAEKCMDYGAIAYARRSPQDIAEYNPLGGTDTEACANCLFFMSPNACTVVEDYPIAISPTGRSRFWTAIPVYEQPPLKVIIVEADGTKVTKEAEKAVEPAGFGRLLTAVKRFLGADPVPVVDTSATKEQPTYFQVFKDAAGDYRWVAWVSNKYRDRDSPPQIINDAAHRDFVDYLDKGGNWPEAWLWHTPGTRWGQADFADYTDGFLVMSGTVDKGQEALAEKLAGEQLGVSHGFNYLYADKQAEVIGWYRTFEVSPLPPWAAANLWTGMDVLVKEATVAMTPAKKAWLTEKLGAEKVSALEGNTEGLAKALQDAGVEYKDIPEGVLETAPAPTAKEIGSEAAKAMLDSEAFKGLVGTVGGLDTDVKAVKESLPAILSRLDKLEKSDDEKIAGAFTAAVKAGTSPGYRASQDPATAVKEGDGLKQAAPLVDDGFMRAFRD